MEEDNVAKGRPAGFRFSAPSPAPAPASSAATAAPGEQPGVAKPADEPWSIGKQVTDLVRAVPGIVQDASNAITGGTLDLANTVQQGADTAMGRSEEVKALHAKETKALQSTLEWHAVQDATTVLGGVTRGVGKWVAIGALVPEAGLGMAAKGAIDFGVGFVATNPEEKNLSNLLREQVGLNDPITEFMAQDSNSSNVVNRLRGALENMLTNGLVRASITKLTAIKEARKLRAAGKVDEADAVLAKGADEAIAQAAEDTAKPQDVSIFPHEKVSPTVNPETADQAISMRTGTPIPGAEKVATMDYKPSSAAPMVAEAGAVPGKVGDRVIDDVRFNGEKPHAASMEANDVQLVYTRKMPDGTDKDLGYLWLTKEDGGYTVRKVFTDPAARRQGVATELNQQAAAAFGPRLGSTAQSAEGKLLTDSLAKKNPKMFGDPALQTAMHEADKPAMLDQVAMRMSKGQDGDVPNIAGVINWGRITKDDDVGKMLNDMAVVGGRDLPDVAGTYQSFKTISRIADKIGQDPAEMLSRLNVAHKATKNLGSLLLGGDALMERAASDMRPIAEKLLSGLGTDADKVMFNHLSDIMLSAMDHVSGIQTAGARATAARRIRVTQQITDKNFASLLEQVGGSEATMALAARLRMAQNTKGVLGSIKGTPSVAAMITDVHNFYWTNSILSGIKTSIVNPVTTAMQTAAMPGFRIIGGIVDVAMGKTSGWDETLKGVQQYKYMTQTFSDAWQFAKRSWRDNESVLIPHAGPLERVGAQSPIDAKYLAQHAAGEAPNILGRAAQATDDVIENFTGIKEGISWLGTVVGAPGRFLTAEDEFFKQIAYRSHVMTEAHMDGLKSGLAPGKALEAHVQKGLLDSLDTAGHALNKDGINAAKVATFTQDLKVATHIGDRSLAEITSTASQNNAFLRGTVLPFTKVPSNLGRNLWDMTPGLNLLRKQFTTDLAAGGEARAMALGKMGFGTMLWSSAIIAANQGLVTGGGPADPELRKQMGPTWQPYSLYVGKNSEGAPRYVSLARLDPFFMPFALAADFAEAGGQLSAQDGGMMKFAEMSVLAMAKNVSSKTYLRGIVDAAEAITSGDERKIERWVGQRIASYVPGVLQSVSTGIDDDLKDVRSVFDHAVSRIPGWSKTLEARRDNFGEKVRPPQGWPWDAINPFTFFTASVDPVRQELAGLAQINSAARFPLPGFTYPEGSREQGHLDLRDWKTASGQSAYDRWLELHKDYKLGDQTLHGSMAELIASPLYKEARKALGNGDITYQDSLATQLVRKQFDIYKKATWQQLLDENPNLREAADQLRIGGKTSKFEGSQTATPIDQIRALQGQR